MAHSDDYNLSLIESSESIDSINAKFYGRFQYPWPPMVFDFPVDPLFESTMLNQSLGNWDHTLLPHYPRIWVAGCGTNQAVFTALRFPNAYVIGSDLSTTSLETSDRIATQLGVANLELRQESLNEIDYSNEFDYVLCTGVIHHNANPQQPLERLSTALKPEGVLELMVYNRYHRIATTAFQKAIRVLGKGGRNVDFESELAIAKAIIDSHTLHNSMGAFLEYFKTTSEAEMADSLLQPVEYSYMIESLDELARLCNLELASPCINQFDKAKGAFLWDLEFDDPAVQELYESFPDLQRWQVSNHLMAENSPQLWFYLQRADSGRQRKSDKDLCGEFLDRKFTRSATQKRYFTMTEDGDYMPGEKLSPYPPRHGDELCARIINAVAERPSLTMREIFSQLGIEPSFTTVNRVRLQTTTREFPYLVAAS